jgi:hypothetical protein
MLRGKIEINRVNWLLKDILTLYMVCDMAMGWHKRGKFELLMLCVNGKVDESRQIRQLTFRENLSRRMRELESSFFIGIVVLDVG